MSIQIRAYRPKDKTDVIRLMVDLQHHVAKLDPLQRLRPAKDFDGVKYFKLLRQGTVGKDLHFLVADDGKKVVGLLIAQVVKNSELKIVARKKHSKPAGKIEELIVDESQRGKGVGRKLLKTGERYLHQQGCGLVLITCFATNTETLKFYRACGYVERDIEFAKKI